MSKNAAAVRPLCIHLLGYLYRTKDFGLLYTDQYPAQGETGSVASVNGKYVVEAKQTLRSHPHNGLLSGVVDGLAVNPTTLCCS